MVSRKIIFASTIFVCLVLNGCQSANRQHFADASANYNPTAAQYNVQLGLGYLREGETLRAKEKLLIALQQEPKSAVANGAMAYFLEQTGSGDEADSYYQRAIRFEPGAGAPLNNYGAYLCRRGQFEKSEKYFSQAVRDEGYVNSADAFENAGLCAMQIPNIALAKKYFEKAIASDAKRMTAAIELADLSYQSGDYQKAEVYLQMFLKNEEPTAQSTWLAYRLARHNHDITKSIEYAQQMREHFHNSPEFKLYNQRKVA